MDEANPIKGSETKAETFQRLSGLHLPGSRDFTEFWDELTKQTDRGVGVLGGAFVDWRVTEAVRSRLPIAGKPATTLLGKDGDEGILDYSTKCLLAHALGLIGDVGLSDLKHIGTIRNRFAHRIAIQSFEHETIRSLCKLLQTVNCCQYTKDLPQDMKNEMRSKPRLHFFTTIYQIAAMITSMANQLGQGATHASLSDRW
jgi:hypothetical protein